MATYTQQSGTTVDTDVSGFEYEQRSGTTVDVELKLGPSYNITINGLDVTEVTIDGNVVSEVTINGLVSQ